MSETSKERLEQEIESCSTEIDNWNETLDDLERDLGSVSTSIARLSIKEKIAEAEDMRRHYEHEKEALEERLTNLIWKEKVKERWTR